MTWTNHHIGSLPVGAYARLMRLDKLTGAYLLLWPCWWSATLASDGIPFYELALFALGALVMRAAGCIINDLWDRDIDRQVARTAGRPLASGEVSAREARTLLAFLLVLAAMVAVSLGWAVFILSSVWLVLVVVYPLMKRVTWWPQLFLGLTFNAGAILGWVAVTGHVEWPAILLYIGSVFWTVGYDTIYAHQDIEDDARIGVKSTARLFGRHSLLAIGVCYSIFFMSLMLLGFMLQLNIPYFLLVILISAQLFLQMVRVDLTNPASCLDAFRSNQWLGALFWLGCCFAKP